MEQEAVSLEVWDKRVSGMGRVISGPGEREHLVLSVCPASGCSEPAERGLAACASAPRPRPCPFFPRGRSRQSLAPVRTSCAHFVEGSFSQWNICSHITKAFIPKADSLMYQNNRGKF